MAEIDKDNEFLASAGVRWLLEHIKTAFRKVGSIIPVSEGGTGAGNAADARTNLGIEEFRGVSGSTMSISGLLPHAPAGGENQVFYGRGEWGDIQGGGGHDDLIAPVESASGSEHAYAIGDQFIIEGVLYITTAAIAVGDAFVVGTNCAINQNITDQIKAIVDSYVTGIKGNAESSYRKGDVNLTSENIGAVPLSTSSGIGTITGNGQYSWCCIARLTITAAYCNGPIAFELSQRQEPVSLIQVCFASSSGTDPDLSYFTTNYSNRYYIKKVDTSTWDLYANYTETWGAVALHRITGYRNGNSVAVTVKMENCSAPSSPTQVTYGGNVGYASSAGSATSATKLKDYTNGNDTWLDYGASALTTCSWVGAWNGYRMGAISPQNLRNKMGLGNTSGALPIANGGTDATTRLGAAKNLTNENVGTGAQYFVTLTDNWGKFGYSSAANARSAMGLGNTTGVLPIANGGTGTNALTTAIKAVRYTITAKTVYNNHGYNLTSTTNSNMPSGYTFLCYLSISSDGFVYSGIKISLPNNIYGGVFADDYSKLNNNGKLGITFLCVKT